VDHKHRDLPAFSLIGYHLTQLGHDVKYCALWEEDNLIANFEPQYIVLPKERYEITRLIKFKLKNMRWITILNEGNHQDKDHKRLLSASVDSLKIVAPDLFTFWNQDDLDRYKKLLSKKTKLELLGYYRTDFLMKPLYDLFPTQEELLSKYGLPLKNKTITFASSVQESHVSNALQMQRASRYQKDREKVKFYNLVVKNSKTLRDITIDVLEHITNKYPNVNIIIKPHPNENIIYWENIINKLPHKNIYLMKDEPIMHLLRVSDLNINHNICTTTFEALLAGVPSVELHSNKSHELYGEDHMNLPQYIAKTIDEVDRVIVSEIINEETKKYGFPKDQKEKLENYIKKYAHRFDGQRCKAYATSIDQFIQKDINGSYDISLFERLRWIYFLVPLTLKQSIKKLTIVKLIRKNISIVDKNTMNSKKTDQLGRYDNRIKSGDEKYWLKKFIIY
jgi:surface carbohydrate biosynthesis protein